MVKSLVIGGNGFLGSSIVDELVAHGDEVSVFDRFSAEALFTSTDVRRIRGDFLDPSALAQAIRGQDQLFHFLSSTTPATAEDDPSGDLRTNVAQTVVLLQQAVDAGVSRVHFASTGGAMYGDTAVERISETVAAAPVSPYAIGKLAIEGYLRYFERKHGLRSVAYRVSNPYGPRQRSARAQGVIPIFLHRIAESLPVRVFGDGSMVRDYIYAEDAARMIVATVGKDTEHPVYNIGSGTGTSLTRIIELAREITGREIVVERSARPATYVERVVLDTARYDAEFGVAPRRDLQEGMALTWRAILGDRG